MKWSVLGGCVAAVAAAAVSGSATAQTVARPANFAMCAVCHKVKEGEKSTLGPNLFKIGGTTAGTRPGFVYSPAMKKSGLKWDRANLIAYLQAPQKLVPGTKMAYAGEKDPAKAAALADYVLSLK